jgi:cyclophilin family peptidyl-prolyl cis-trans isomerase
MRKLFSKRTRRHIAAANQRISKLRKGYPRRIEPLESRHLLSVTFPGLNDIQTPVGKYTLVPLSAFDSQGEPIHYSFSSDNANVQLALVSPASKSLVLNVSGTDNTDTAFSGTLVLHLFEDLSPATATRIETLAGMHFYDGLSFTRVIDGFMSQGGDNGKGGTGTTLNDEFNTALTFNSPGLLAMANAGPDTADSQFFITAIDGKGTTTPITLAAMPQFLNFRYTIFGQMVSGFDTFEKIMTVQVTDNPQITDPNTMMPEQSKPVHTITINSAQVITDNHDAVLSVFVPAGFSGSTAKITVDAKNTDNDQVEHTFNVAAVTDSVTDPPFLGPVGNQSTAVGHTLNIPLTSTDHSDAGVYYGFASFDSTTHASSSIDQTMSQLTVTPDAGFTGPLKFIVGVQDSAGHYNFDTQVFTLTVVAPTLDAVANQTIAVNAPANFTLHATDSLGNNVVYSILDATTHLAPTDADVSITQATGEVTVTPHAGFKGTLNLLAAVRDTTSPDAFANYTTQPFSVTVVAPTLDPVSNQSVAVNAPANFTLHATDSLGNNVVYSILDATTHLAPTDADVSITQATGEVIVTPHAGFKGTLNLLAAVRDTTSPDAFANYTTQPFSVTVVAPTLDPVVDQTVPVNVPSKFTLLSNDPLSNDVVYAIFDASTHAAPADASVDIKQPDGEVTVTPHAGFVGTLHLVAGVRDVNSPDVFANYTVRDFALDVVAPTLDVVPKQTTVLDVPITFTLSATDPPFNNSLVYKVVDAGTFADPANADVAIDQATAQVTITPHAGFSGIVQLTAAVRDATSPDVPDNYTKQNFQFVVADLVQPADQTTIVGTPVQGTLSTAPLADDLFFDIFAANSFSAPANVQVTIDHPTGVFTLSPAAGFHGDIQLRAGVRIASAANQESNYSFKPFTLTVNPGPALDAVADKATSRGTPIQVTLSASNVTADGTIFKIFAADSFDAPANVAVSINQTTHIVTLTPTAGFTGPINLRAGVRGGAAVDDPANYDLQSFTLTVNAVPVMDSVANNVTSRGTPIQFTISASDVTSDGAFFKIFAANSFDAPANVDVSIDPTIHLVTLTPSAGFTGDIHLRAGVRGGLAIDDPANYDLQSFTLTVNPVPVMDAVSDKNVAKGSSISFTLTASDATANGVHFAIFDGASFSAPAHVKFMLSPSTGVLILTPDADFTGITLRAGVRDAQAIEDPANYDLKTFTLNVLTPSLDPIPTQITDVGVQKSFSLNVTDPVGHGLVYSIVDPTSLGTPAHVSVQINQAGQVTLTPDAGFGGFIPLRARVRFADSPDVADSYATRDFTLQVNSTINVAAIGDVQLPPAKSVLVPLSGLDTGGQAINYQFQSSDPGVHLELVSPASQSLVLNVSGTDSHGDAFSGKLVLKLFEDLAPETTARIKQLIQQDYYAKLLFHRVLNGFVAQTGQSNGGADTGVLLNDEFNTELTFTSPGLLAMANRGRDTADAEFFITALDTAAGSPVTLADMPQSLNFRYTIFGQLVSGFDTFQKIMTANVVFNPPLNEVSSPSPSIHLDSASLITDTQNAVLRVFAPSGFSGAPKITVTATNPTGQMTQRTFNVASAADPHANDPPFLGSVTNQTTTAGVGVNFTLTSTDLSARGVVYSIFDATTHAAPANITVNIDQATGRVTLTPAATLSGPIKLLAAVRSSADQDIFDNYDTQAFTLTVSAPTTPAAPTALAIDSSSYTGPFDGNGYITNPTPKLTVHAAPGATVQFKLNGQVIATGTETSPGSGQYTAMLPAGKLAVGVNAITAVVTSTGGTSVDSTPFNLTYAPNYGTGIYVVPGAAGSTQVLAMAWTVRRAKYNDEIGYFIVDSLDGSIGGVTPGQAGYAKAGIGGSSAQVIFASGQKAGASTPITLTGGQMIVFYMIQNNTTANFLARNPTNSVKGNNNGAAPLAFFSIPAANPDGMKHAQIIPDPTTGRVQYSWEDLAHLGDSDFNDVVMTVRLASDTSAGSTKVASTLHAPGASDKSVSVSATLHAAKKSAPTGDVGVFFVDNPAGAIGLLKPGDKGYAAAALATGNFQVIFTSKDSAGATKSISVPGGKYLAFFYIAGGTAEEFSSSNPDNATGGGRPVALFSFDAANPDTSDHFHWNSPEGVAMDPDRTQLHMMDKVFGSEKDFDDLIMDVDFASSASLAN